MSPAWCPRRRGGHPPDGVPGDVRIRSPHHCYSQHHRSATRLVAVARAERLQDRLCPCTHGKPCVMAEKTRERNCSERSVNRPAREMRRSVWIDGHDFELRLGLPFCLVEAILCSSVSLIDCAICFDAPLRLLLLVSPRLAAKAAPAAICCAFDFAGMIKSPVPGFTANSARRRSNRRTGRGNGARRAWTIPRWNPPARSAVALSYS